MSHVYIRPTGNGLLKLGYSSRNGVREAELKRQMPLPSCPFLYFEIPFGMKAKDYEDKLKKHFVHRKYRPDEPGEFYAFRPQDIRELTERATREVKLAIEEVIAEWERIGFFDSGEAMRSEREKDAQIFNAKEVEIALKVVNALGHSEIKPVIF